MLSHETKHLQLATLTLEAEQAYLAIRHKLGGEGVWVSWQYQEAIITSGRQRAYDKEM